MDAKEARSRAIAVNTANQWGYINRQIRDSAENGKYEYFHNDVISPELRKRLSEDGFKVGKTQNDKNDLLTRISW